MGDDHCCLSVLPLKVARDIEATARAASSAHSSGPTVVQENKQKHTRTWSFPPVTELSPNEDLSNQPNQGSMPLIGSESIAEPRFLCVWGSRFFKSTPVPLKGFFDYGSGDLQVYGKGHSVLLAKTLKGIPLKQNKLQRGPTGSLGGRHSAWFVCKIRKSR